MRVLAQGTWPMMWTTAVTSDGIRPFIYEACGTDRRQNPGFQAGLHRNSTEINGAGPTTDEAAWAWVALTGGKSTIGAQGSGQGRVSDDHTAKLVLAEPPRRRRSSYLQCRWRGATEKLQRRAAMVGDLTRSWSTGHGCSFPHPFSCSWSRSDGWFKGKASRGRLGEVGASIDSMSCFRNQ